MRKKYLIIALIASLLLSVAVFSLFANKTNAPNTPSDKNNLIQAEQPLPGQVIKSPLVVSGYARGTWYFEASFPIKLLDANNQEIAVIPAQAQSDWMTTDFVPFKAILEFTTPKTDTGTLVLKKDNPSGLPEHEDELLIPIRFR